MNDIRTNAARFAVAVTAATVLLPLYTDTVHAGDHVDAPKTTAYPAADITGLYAWHTDDGKIVAVLNFAGFKEPGQPATLDDTVLYGIHIDNNGDNKADQNIWVRFGKDPEGAWGVQVTDLPGADPVVVGPIETVLDAGLGLRVFAGLRDDPFFFDLVGFEATKTTGELSFDKDRDSFAATNVTSIVVEMNTDAALGAAPSLRLWASTRVKA